MEEKLKVRITHTNFWYHKDEVHEVFNHVVFGFYRCNACFEKEYGKYGIELTDCEVLGATPLIPDYTMEELTEKIGHEFKIKK